MIDVEILKNALEYFPEIGVFRWKISPAKNIAIGSIAGAPDNRGYWQIRCCRRLYYAHRLAWLFMTEEWPAFQLDHKNLNKSDNRWENLRAATATQNRANQRGYGKYPKGVCLQGKKFQAQIQKNGKHLYLGIFATQEEASEAYAIAAKQYFGEYARTC